MFITDFEQAAIMATEEEFGGRVAGCYFHFKQSLIRNLGILKTKYGKFIDIIQ